MACFWYLNSAPKGKVESKTTSVGSIGLIRVPDSGEEYRVRLFDGSEKTVRDDSLAMNYGEGSTVVYTDPKEGKQIKGTILASNGNFW